MNTTWYHAISTSSTLILRIARCCDSIYRHRIAQYHIMVLFWTLYFIVSYSTYLKFELAIWSKELCRDTECKKQKTKKSEDGKREYYSNNCPKDVDESHGVPESVIRWGNHQGRKVKTRCRSYKQDTIVLTK